jgi:predicted DNA-binding transcriptional regulator AlpA
VPRRLPGLTGPERVGQHLLEELSALTGDERRRDYDRLTDTVGARHGEPEWVAFLATELGRWQRAEEAEREREYLRSAGQKGGRAHPSRWRMTSSRRFKTCTHAIQTSRENHPQQVARQIRNAQWPDRQNEDHPFIVSAAVLAVQGATVTGKCRDFYATITGKCRIETRAICGSRRILATTRSHDDVARTLMRTKTRLAAAKLGLSESTVEKMRVERRGPPFIRIGRSVFYEEEDLDAWIEAAGA